MSGIRVTYSGMLAFALNLVSYFLGIVFTLVVTRTLVPTEYGEWNLINGLILYVLIAEPIVSYWTTRLIARGNIVGKTALLSNSFMSIFAVLGYFVSSYFVGPQANAHLNILFFGAIIIPVVFLNRTLHAINLGFKPQGVSYGQVAFTAMEILLAVILVYFLHMAVLGVIITVFFAHITSIVVQLFLVRDKIQDRLKIQHLKKWVRLSWLPIYPGLAGIILRLDVTIFSVFTASVVGLAYWSAAIAITLVITLAANISSAVYPKLLGGEDPKYLRDNLIQLFYFVIPLAAMTIIFARPALFLLNPVYQSASLVVALISVQVCLITINTVFQSLLTGIENVDLNENSTFKDYVKSKLFFIPNLSLIQNGSYIVLLIAVLVIFGHSFSSLLTLVFYWSVLAAFCQLPSFIYFVVLMRRHFAQPFDIKTISKYVLVCICSFGMVYVISNHFISYEQSILGFAMQLLVMVAFAFSTYLGITYLVDKKTRSLFSAIVKEIKSR